MYTNLAILAVLVFLYSLIARRFENSIISGPIIFVSAGLLLGPLAFDWLKSDITGSGLRVIADLTLALVLFIDAANVNLKIVKHTKYIPLRMLLLGLPGVILFGTIVGTLLLLELTLFEVAVLATVLAATDAALGKAVITNKVVPERIREGLNVESGLNDGLCVPILFVFLALAEGSVGEGKPMMLAVTLVAEELGIGLIIGLGFTMVAAWLFKFCKNRGWVSEIWMPVTAVALAIGCFATAQNLHGSGYIAAFSGGLLFGHLMGKSTHELIIGAEGLGETLAMLTWILFGTVVISRVVGTFTWEMLLYAGLSLTIIRMLPIYLCLRGTGEPVSSRLFLGWFGPRGLASIVFAVIVMEHDLPGSRYIAMVVVCTVFFSLVLHGLSATLLSKWLGGKEKTIQP